MGMRHHLFAGVASVYEHIAKHPRAECLSRPPNIQDQRATRNVNHTYLCTAAPGGRRLVVGDLVDTSRVTFVIVLGSS